MAMRIVLMGTGEFALPLFRSLIDSAHVVVGILTQPDKTGRGHHHHINPIKQLGVDRSIPVFQPERVNRPDSLESLRSLNADVFVVAAYGQILKPELLAIPRLGAFNLHGSLLPRHRGAAPVQYSIWCGDQLTGVTMFQIEPSLDSGPMAGQVITDIGPQETSGELMMRLAELSIGLTENVLQQLESGSAKLIAQDPAQVTLAPRIEKSEGLIRWNQTARQIDCHIRAMQPWPRAFTWLLRDDHAPLRCLILQAAPVSADLVPPALQPATGVSAECSARKFGRLHADGGQLYVQTADGLLQVHKIQPDGRKSMDSAAFLNGHPWTESLRFSDAPFDTTV